MPASHGRRVRGLLLPLAMLCSGVSAQEYIRLIPSAPVPPLNAPELSRTTRFSTSAIELLAKAGPWYNEKRVRDELQANIDREVAKGFADAAASGQRGVLVLVQVLSTPTVSGPYFQLRGDGAVLVGSGPGADAVCFSQKCFGEKLDVPIPAGTTLAAGSGYLWVERGANGKYVQGLYQANALEARASQVYLNQAARETYAQRIKGEAFADYMGTLGRRVKAREQKTMLDELESKRKAAIAEAARIESEYEKEMLRQAQLQAAANTLSALQGILSTASMLAAASNAIGASLGDVKDFSSPAAVTEKLKAMALQSGATVADIRVRQTTVRNAQGQAESQILQFGVQFDMPVPPQGSVLMPKP